MLETARVSAVAAPKQQSCLKELAAQKKGSHFFWNMASLDAGEFV
jgi:hypothetical protein